MITPIQSRMARAALKWGVRDLAQHANVGVATVVRFESGKPVIPATLAVMQRALEEVGVRFTADGGVVPPTRPA
jgi:transcriptional regulator with XRE-family HTH domain